MSRSVIALTALSALLAGGLVVSLIARPEPGVNAAAVREIVKQEMAAAPKPEASPKTAQTANADAALGPIIESYLLQNPQLLRKMSEKLQNQEKADAQSRTQTAINSMKDQIFNDPQNAVVGNPKGDVTLVEYFDYNCPYCKAAVPDMEKLIASDPNLRVVYKEFPILSQESLQAARIAAAVALAGGDYEAFHSKLFAIDGKLGKEQALKAVAAIGLDPATIEKAAQDPKIAEIIQRAYAEAQALNITGTPSYVIGDTVLPGRVGEAKLRELIDNVRKCGSATCSG